MNTKKTIAILILFLTLSVSHVEKSHAQLVVTDPFNTAQQTINTVTSGLDWVNTNVLTPLRDAATVASVLQNQDAVMNMVFGDDALFITNPQEYLMKESLIPIQAALGELKNTQGAYNDSIASMLIEDAKTSSRSFIENINDLNRSDIPKIQQEALCTDEALSEQAEEDVTDENGDFEQSTYTARKRELQRNLCGDLTKPETKAALAAVSSAEGYNEKEYLALINGDNFYTKSVATQETVAEEIKNRKDAKQKELDNNGGIKSETNCITFGLSAVDSEDDEDGAEPPCLQEEITKSADSIKDSVNKALSSIQDLQISSYGEGARGILGALTNTFSIINSTKQLLGNGKTGGKTSTPKTGGLPGGGSGSGNPLNDDDNTGVTTDSSYPQDLADNPQAKEQLTESALEYLQSRKDTLTTLTTTDSDYLRAIDTYLANLNQVKSCYDSNQSSDGNAKSFLISEINTSEAKRQEITAEQSLISDEEDLIRTTSAKVEASMSSQEMNALLSEFDDAVKSQKLPDQTTSGTRLGEYTLYNATVEKSAASGGKLFTLNTSCR